MASSCSGSVSKLSTDGLRDLLDGLGGVDGDEPLAEDRGELAVAVVDGGGELVSLALDPVGFGAAPLGGLLGRQEEQEGAVGQESSGREQVQLEYSFDAEPASEP